MREYNYRLEAGLVSGLRKTAKNRRGIQAMVQTTGALPYDGALNSLPELEAIDTSSITPTPVFPYPQLFVLKEITIVCTATQIYERASDGTLTLGIGSLTEGWSWTVADFHHFIVLANGKQLVFRGGEDKQWTTANTYGLEVGTSVCNFKGQLIITAPDAIITDAMVYGQYSLDFSWEDNSMYIGVI